jgi:outer membrane protein assembly factor BamB
MVVRAAQGILGAFAVVAAASVLVAPAGAANSVAYQVNARHTGHQEDVNLEPPFQRLWARAFPGPTSYPVIAGDRVFLTVANRSSYGTSLYALSRPSGRVLWRRPLGGRYYWSGIAYGDNRVYAVNFDGVLSAFDPASGNLVWQRDLPDQWSFDAPPTYRDGMVYVSGAGFGGTLYAVTRGGKLAWTQPVENGDKSSPAVGERKVFVSYACAQTYAFNRTNGSQLWHWDAGCEGGGGRTSVLHRGRLYVRDFRSGYVLSALSGNLVNVFAAGPSVGGPPPVFRGTEGFIIVDGELRAFNPSTGSVDWTFKDPEARTGGAIASAPLVVNGNVLVGSSEGMLYAVDGTTGRRVWHGYAGAPFYPSDEQNVFRPLTGFAAGQGTLVIPAGSRVVAYGGS